MSKVNTTSPSLLLVVVLSLSFYHAGAQAPKRFEKDSLLELYTRGTTHDTSSVILLNNLSRAYRTINPDSAIRFSREAYESSTTLSYQKGIAISLNFLGAAYFYKGDYPMAEDYQRRALAYSEEHHLTEQASNSLNSLALAYQYQGNYLSALDAYLQALQFEEQSKNLYGRVKVLANIGLLWKAQGDFDKSIAYSQQALKLIDSLKDGRTVRANVLNNLGVAYMELKKYSEAKDYVEQSLKLNRELGKTVFEISSLLNIGFCFLKMDQLDSAEYYTSKALQQTARTDITREHTLLLLNTAEIYKQKGQLAKALTPSLEALDLAKKANDKSNTLLSYQALAGIYTRSGQLPTALAYMQKAMSLSDSLKNADITQKLRDIQKSYELSKKESEITLLAKDAEIRNAALVQERNVRTGLILLLVAVFVFAAIAYYSFTAKAALSKQLQLQNVEIRTQKELIEGINEDLKAQALRAQMNPHFIFNALNSIQFLIFKNNNEKAYHYLAQFSKLLRQVLDMSAENLVSVASEQNTLGLYLELESLRFDGGFTYEITTTFERERAEQMKIMPMIIQPFVENAILHGLMPKTGDRRLTIHFLTEGTALVCQVTDNGIGRKASSEINRKKRTLHQSKGIKFTNERISVSNTMNRNQSHIDITDLMNENQTPAGTRVRITFQN